MEVCISLYHSNEQRSTINILLHGAKKRLNIWIGPATIQIVQIQKQNIQSKCLETRVLVRMMIELTQNKSDFLCFTDEIGFMYAKKFFWGRCSPKKN